VVTTDLSNFHCSPFRMMNGENIANSSSTQLALSIEPAKVKLRMNGTLGRLQFRSVLEAKLKAFDLIDSGAAHAYFSTKKFRSDYFRKQRQTNQR
jgi:hypothetical protein